MTDLEKFIELYKSFGITCVVVNHDGVNSIFLGDYEHGYGDATKGTYSESFSGGYSGFYSQVVFDADGKFRWQSFRE